MGLFSFLREHLGGGAAAAEVPTAGTLTAKLANLHLPTVGIEVQGDTAVLTGPVPDGETREKILLAVGNTNGIAHVDDRMTGGEASGNLGNVLGGFSRVPAGSANTQAAETAVHGSAPTGMAQGPGGSVFYTVQKGDTLSGIAKKQYGDANAYMRIFEANKPMLTDPDKIYPGQVLRVPPKP